MTAEECLLWSLFAMVSSDCHVRNAWARTRNATLCDEFSRQDQESCLMDASFTRTSSLPLARIHAVCVWVSQSFHTTLTGDFFKYKSHLCQFDIRAHIKSQTIISPISIEQSPNLNTHYLYDKANQQILMFNKPEQENFPHLLKTNGNVKINYC